MDQEKEREEEVEEKAENVEMVGQDAGVGDHFFDGEEDDGQVDMAVVFEAMKHVPLPDFDYAESDDTSPAELEDFPAQAAGPRASEHDPSKVQSISWYTQDCALRFSTNLSSSNILF